MTIAEILFLVRVMYAILLYIPTYYLVQYIKPNFFQNKKAQQSIDGVMGDKKVG